MKHVDEKIQAFIAGELAGEQQQAVTDHLADCPACAHAVEQARHLWSLVDEAATLAPLPGGSAWAGIQARTFGRARSSLLYGGGLWSKTGIAATALAAGLALAILLPSENSEQSLLPGTDEMAWGSSFWLDEQSDTAFSELWLAAADEGDES
jgi:anti-sigma factor RsiW